MSTSSSTQSSAATSARGSVAATTAAPQYTGPTEAITAVANAITVEHKSLDILVSVAPLLTYRETADVAVNQGGSLYPVTISISFTSPVGASGKRKRTAR